MQQSTIKELDTPKLKAVLKKCVFSDRQGARTLYYLIEKIRCIYAVLANKIIRCIYLCSCVFMSRFGRDLNPIRDG